MAEETTHARIALAPGGPYIVDGITELTGADGQPVPARQRMALCRCGHTANSPFCDGAHTAHGFAGAAAAELSKTQSRAYTGRDVTVRYNRAICAHAALCVTGLPSVFNIEARPWIQPDNADAAAVIDRVDVCPSGALSYTVEGGTPAVEAGPAAIAVCPHGPLAVTGAVELVGIEPAGGASATRCTLCRCGESKARPFCDGTHITVGFRDPA